jgi:hypothetical protein
MIILLRNQIGVTTGSSTPKHDHVHEHDLNDWNFEKSEMTGGKVFLKPFRTWSDSLGNLLAIILIVRRLLSLAAVSGLVNSGIGFGIAIASLVTERSDCPPGKEHANHE